METSLVATMLVRSAPILLKIPSMNEVSVLEILNGVILFLCPLAILSRVSLLVPMGLILIIPSIRISWITTHIPLALLPIPRVSRMMQRIPTRIENVSSVLHRGAEI